MAEIDWLVVVSRWLHIGAAIVALGGAAYARAAVLPSLAEALDDESAGKVREAIRRRWAKVTHGCIALLLLTGVGNFVMVSMASKVEPMPYHAIFGVKVMAALVIFFLATALAGRSAGLAAIRAQGRKWLSVVLVLGALVVLLSGVLKQVRTTGAARSTPLDSLISGE